MHETSKQANEHVPEIDWLKGLAILLVVCIHAKPYENSLPFEEIVNRAVPIFLVLFGISSELWWRKEAARAPEGIYRRWWSTRLRRVLPGYWALIAIWWVAVAFMGRPEIEMPLGGPQVLLSFVAHAPWIGTAWFVTVLLEYVFLFPLLRPLLLRLGAPLTLGIAVIMNALSCWFVFAICDFAFNITGERLPAPGWYYQWIFPPRILWHVAAGMFVARYWAGRISWRVTLIATVLSVIGIAARDFVLGLEDEVLGGLAALTISQVFDVPVAIALLGILRLLPLPRQVRAFLRWCGLWSWGIYLGHLLIHELLILSKITLFTSEIPQVRIAYAGILLIGGVVIALIADRSERSIARLFPRSKQRAPATASPSAPLLNSVEPPASTR